MTSVPYEILVGLRYLRGRRSGSVSFVSAISMAGITLGIAALITVSSVLNGFEREVRARILGAVSHVTVRADGLTPTEWSRLAERLRTYPNVVAHAPFLQAEAIAARGRTVSGVAVRGILPQAEAKVSNFAADMKQGTLEDLKSGGFGVVVGSGLAESMRLEVGSRLSLALARSQAAEETMPRLQRFTVVGIFKTDMYEYDNGLVLIHIDDATGLFQGRSMGLRLKLNDLDVAPAVAAKIAGDLGPGIRVSDWTRENAIYFRALRMQKTVIFLIVFLIVAVAMFNMVATLLVIVKQKKGDIAILRTIGASPASIVWIFVINGALLGVIGTVIGTTTGVLLALNVDLLSAGLDRLLDTTLLPADVYLLSKLPSDLRWQDVALIAGFALALALLSSIYPARRAARLQPAEALRYE